MQSRIHKFVWLGLASALILSLTLGAVLAHEGRPVGDYRFIVGWLEEPAYEGSQNAVSVRVNKIVPADSMEAGATTTTEEGDHGPPGHHGEGEDGQDGDGSDHHGNGQDGDGSDHHSNGQDGDGSDHHGDGQDGDGSDHHGDGQDGDGSDHHGNGQDGDSSDHHGDGEGDHHASTVEAESAMSVAVEATLDAVSGVNLHVILEGFAFAPESVNGEHVAGEGHAHVYVDGVKISRVYTPWLHLDDLAVGRREIRVTLNANSHPRYTWNGELVEAATRILVPDLSGTERGHHGPDTVAAQAAMSVSIRVEPDSLGGANLFITDTPGFTFAPQNASGEHVAGEGHANVYVNGVKAARVYGNAYQLGQMAEGKNKVRVTLNANDHARYTWSGLPVEATVAVEIEAGMGGAGYGDGNGMAEGEVSSSLLPIPSGSGKPLASVAGQDEGVAVPVEGLEQTLQVEVTHVASGASRVFDLHAAWGDPGHYVAGLIPTASGVYEFRVFGSIEGVEIDETFVSAGAGGDFDDVQTSADLQFPVQLPELREVESGVRGAIQTAQEAQDAALAAQADGGSGNTLAIVALIVGVVGALLGASGIFFGIRARQSQ